MIAKTPKPPYYAVIFSSIKNSIDKEQYQNMAERMELLVLNQQGFLGYEYAQSGLGITISYWKDLESIRKWKENEQHQIAQQQGKEKWYSQYKVRIALVNHDYEF
jgi:heme-degrading monooxygenase HmoA